MTDGEAFLRSLELQQDEAVVPQKVSAAPDAGKDEESFLAALEQAAPQDGPSPQLSAGVLTKNDEASSEEAFLAALENAAPQDETPAAMSVAAGGREKSSDEDSFLLALENLKPEEDSSADMQKKGNASGSEEAFLRSLEQSDANDGQVNNGALQTKDSMKPSDIDACSLASMTCDKWQPLRGEIVSPTNIAFLKQLDGWLQQCPQEAERLLAYLGIFCRLDSDTQKDVFYIVLRELGRALCDCLNKAAGSSSAFYETLSDWSFLIKGISPQPCQLKIPYPGGSEDSSWMQSHFPVSVVKRIRTWAVVNQENIIYPAEIE